MTAKKLPSIEYLRKRLRYEPATGRLFWLPYEGMHKRWLARYAGKEAFTSFTALDGKGYQCGRIDDVTFLAHRVAWAIHYGEWPDDQIDHINGLKADNRIANLRVVTNQENQRNTKMQSNNASGVTGVYWHKRAGKWAAQIMVDYKPIHLGLFITIEEAAQARAQANVKHGYSERHGEAVQ